MIKWPGSTSKGTKAQLKNIDDEKNGLKNDFGPGIKKISLSQN